MRSDVWPALHRLQMTYASVRRYEINRLLGGGRTPVVRNVSAALARLTLITQQRPDLTVLSRMLEHDLFLHGAILTINIDAVLQVVGGNRPDRGNPEQYREGGACDPLRAAQEVIGTLDEFGERPAFTSHCDIAADGTHTIELDGTRREIPPWGRWALRAASWHAAADKRAPPPRAFTYGCSVTWSRCAPESLATRGPGSSH